jgi:peptidoglycan/LPS O-acetylase OafA/YrhL
MPNHQTVKTNHRWILLDIIRSVAIFLVVIAHIGFSTIGWFRPGSIGVSLFLILSGMTLGYSYIDRCPSFMPFIQKRIMRIYPTYFMALTIAALILSSNKFPANVSEAFLTLAGFCAFAGKWGCSLVETSWFIGLIMSLYAIYPYLATSMWRRPYTTIVTLFVVSTISNLLAGELLPRDPLAWFPLCRIFEFGLGIFLVQQKNIVDVIKNYRLPWADKVFAYISDISLPVFLIHYPLVSVIPFWRALGGTWFGLVVYFAMTWILSHLMLIVDRGLQMHFKDVLSEARLSFR